MQTVAQMLNIVTPSQTCSVAAETASVLCVPQHMPGILAGILAGMLAGILAGILAKRCCCMLTAMRGACETVNT